MMLYWSILFLIISHHQATPFFIPVSFSDLKALAEFAYDTYGKFEEVYGLYESNTANEETSLDDVLAAVREVANKVEEIGVKIERHLDEAVATLLQRLPLEFEIIEKKSDLHDAIIRVDALFDRFVLYSADRSNFNNITIQRFIDTITEDAGVLQTSLMKMQKVFVVGRTSGIASSLFTLLNKQTLLTTNEICDTGTTPQLELFRFYEMIMKTHVRGFLMISFANLMREVVYKTSFQVELKLAETEVLVRAIGLMTAAKSEMQKAPRALRRCDPRVHKRDETFLEFNNFMQGFIANEYKLNEEDSCRFSCSTLPLPIRMRFYKTREDRYHAGSTFCHGQLIDCSYGGDSAWEICMETEAPRLYSYFVNGAGSKFGKKTKCTDWQIKRPIAEQPKLRNHCDFCQCTCIQDGITSWSRRIISFRPQISDIANGKVVTGVRFIGKHEFLHIQIKEGKLYPDGRIDGDTEAWKELEPMLYLSNVSKLNSEVHVVREVDGNWQKQRYGRDFGVLRYEQRKINLDDLFAPTHHVVTGIRFRHPKPPKTTEIESIEIAIHVTPFNYAKGTLEPTGEDIWVTANRKLNRNKIDLAEKRYPPNSPPSLPDSKAGDYVEIQHSDWWDDAAQSTIPFLDSQPVEGRPGFPLAGVGLFHKGAKHYGGFLAMRIYSLDLPEYMSAEIPEELFLT